MSKRFTVEGIEESISRSIGAKSASARLSKQLEQITKPSRTVSRFINAEAVAQQLGTASQSFRATDSLMSAYHSAAHLAQIGSVASAYMSPIAEMLTDFQRAQTMSSNALISGRARSVATELALNIEAHQRATLDSLQTGFSTVASASLGAAITSCLNSMAQDFQVSVLPSASSAINFHHEYHSILNSNLEALWRANSSPLTSASMSATTELERLASYSLAKSLFNVAGPFNNFERDEQSESTQSLVSDAFEKLAQVETSQALVQAIWDLPLKVWKALHPFVRFLLICVATWCVNSSLDAFKDYVYTKVWDGRPSQVASVQEVKPRFGRITGNGLRIRGEPKLDSRVLGRLDRTKIVMVLGETDDWVRVQYHEGEDSYIVGWVSREFIIIAQPPV